MLFNSPIFLFAFLPVAVLGFYAVARLFGTRAARAWLVSASIFFYSWTVPTYVILLVGSILFNYFIGKSIEQEKVSSRSRHMLVIGIVANLGILGYFKYANFIVQSFATIGHFEAPIYKIILPLAISFFTFQQIAYLVNCYRKQSTQPTLLDYACFVTFFPHLIAGPIVQHSDILPQFQRDETYRANSERIATGLAIFILGLAKKVILADEFGNYANVGFHGASVGDTLTFYEAWGAALSYTLQLYFDFSGYSDMAIGLGLLFGIDMPINFNSPYKAHSIIDFWRRWHMTLSRFLREFVYIPLGGNRHGSLRRHINLILTMLIGGLWHGASWTFVIWGGLHGLMLTINHGWEQLRAKFSKSDGSPRPILRGIPAWLLTFTCVIAGWVIFRAPTLAAAKQVYLGMLGLNGFQLPADLVGKIPLLKLLGNPVGALRYFNDGTNIGFIRMSIIIVMGLVICLFMPNIREMSPRARLVVITLTFALVIQKVLFSNTISHFIYFQF